jgi:hypothetical protein
MYLAVIESPGDSKIVDVFVEDRGHLRFLDGADTTLRM